jgi:two-component system, NarL family, nitrate/nitrite response regulator NarL
MDTKRHHPIRIVIADDHPIFRDGLRRLLEAESDLMVIGEACDGAEAVELTRQLNPDILLLDLAMPHHPGLEALRDLSAPQGPNSVRVILLTAAVEKSQIVEALQLGARGVVLKDSATQLLIKSIHTVMSGQYWVGREAVSNLVQHLHTLLQSSTEEARQKDFGLTPRELEVVSAVVDGDSNKEIAQRCHIEENTVKHHLTNIFNKLGVSTRLALALFAVNHLHLKTTTRVSFVSNPAGADIEVDGRFLGSTPAELPLALGQRVIRVYKKGFKPYQRTVQVLSGGAQRISVDLEPTSLR